MPLLGTQRSQPAPTNVKMVPFSSPYQIEKVCNIIREFCKFPPGQTKRLQALVGDVPLVLHMSPDAVRSRWDGNGVISDERHADSECQHTAVVVCV